MDKNQLEKGIRLKHEIYHLTRQVAELEYKDGRPDSILIDFGGRNVNVDIRGENAEFLVRAYKIRLTSQLDALVKDMSEL